MHLMSEQELPKATPEEITKAQEELEHYLIQAKERMQKLGWGRSDLLDKMKFAFWADLKD
jgi:hypothetical protein